MNCVGEGAGREKSVQRVGKRRAQTETSPLVMLKAWFEQADVSAHHSAK